MLLCLSDDMLEPTVVSDALSLMRPDRLPAVVVLVIMAFAFAFAIGLALRLFKGGYESGSAELDQGRDEPLLRTL